jgi:hypothetical protein
MKNQFGKTAIFAAFVLGAGIAGAQGISVEVNGNPVQFHNAQPQYLNGRVLVPLRGVFENMGAYVQWNPTTRTVNATKGGTDVKLRIGDRWASVNGHTQSLDVPAMIIGGSTMVPIRFVSESLGAQVAWNDPERLVMISTNGYVYNNENRPVRFANRRRFNLPAGTVIPATLETRVSSRDTRSGDLVRARINDFVTRPVNYERGIFDFPNGSMIEGRVVSAVPRNGNRPGMIEMDFNRIVLPDGQSFPINGALTSLNGNGVYRNSNGMLVTRNSSKDNRMVYAGYGAGAGLLVGLLTKRPLEDLAIGGILGYLAGSIQQSQQHPNDVVLEPGTRFGVRLESGTTITLPVNR